MSEDLEFDLTRLAADANKYHAEVIGSERTALVAAWKSGGDAQ